MVETGKTISQLVSEIAGYYMIKDKFAADKSQAERIIDSAKKVFADAEINTTDGCRFDFKDGWLHLRASNTEPVMRVIVEAKNQSIARRYIDAVLGIRGQILG
jgi:phosphomannomutase